MHILFQNRVACCRLVNSASKRLILRVTPFPNVHKLVPMECSCNDNGNMSLYIPGS
jgi:hypothetical protein